MNSRTSISPLSSNTEIVKIKLTNQKPTSRTLAKPIKIRVSTGGKRATVMAHSLVEAFELFLNKKEPEALGVLVEFKTKEWDPGDDTFYMSTVSALKQLEKFSEE